MTGGAQGRRRQRRLQTMEVNPGRWLAVGQRLRLRPGDARAGEGLAGGAGAGREAGSEPVDHSDRHHGGDAAPSLPAMEATQIVGTHDPDETHARTVLPQIRDGLVGIRRADLRFQIGDIDARVVRERLGSDDAPGKRGKPAGVFEWISGRHQPPDPVEIEPLHGEQTGAEMRLVRRIERAAEETDAHPRSVGREHDARRGRFTLFPCGRRLRLRQRSLHGMICPDPCTRYLKLVNCSPPTGPRAWKRPVAMPISAPKPNSPPSANWVEALCNTIAESTSLTNFFAAALSSVTIESVWCEPKRSICSIAASTPSITLAEMTASRYSVDQSSSLAGFTRRSTARVASSPRTSQPASSSMVTSGLRCVDATAGSTSSVSAAPQTPVRRILALSRIVRAMSSFAALST